MNRSTNKPAVAAALLAAAVVAAPAAWLARAGVDRDPSRQASAGAGRAAAAADSAEHAPPEHTGPRHAGARQPGARRAADTPSGSADGPRVPTTDRARGPRPVGQRPVPADEWAGIAAFMSNYMPWRIGEVQQMPEGVVKERIKRLLANRYRGLRMLQNRDPDSYEQRLGQLRIEDQVYKLVSELSSADPDRRQKIREELRTQVAALVDVDLRERRRRVERLEDELRKQKKMLEQDTNDHDGIVERRVGRFLDWGSRWPALRGTGRPDVDAKPEGAKGDAANPRVDGKAGAPGKPDPLGNDVQGPAEADTPDR